MLDLPMTQKTSTNKLPEVLRSAMRDRGLRGADVARELQENPASLSRWLSGSIPEFDSCIALAKVLMIEPEEILAATGRPEYVTRFRALLEMLGARRKKTGLRQSAQDEIRSKYQDVYEKLDALMRDTVWGPIIAANIRAIYRNLGMPNA